MSRTKPYMVAARAVAATAGPYVDALRPRLERDIETAAIHKDHAHLDSFWWANREQLVGAVHVDTGIDYELAEHVVLAAMYAHPIVGAPLTTPTVLAGAMLAAKHIVREGSQEP